METNYFTYWDCLKEINEFEKTYPFFCPHIDTDAPLETILLEVVREYSELERKMETMDKNSVLQCIDFYTGGRGKYEWNGIIHWLISL